MVYAPLCLQSGRLGSQAAFPTENPQNSLISTHPYVILIQVNGKYVYILSFSFRCCKSKFLSFYAYDYEETGEKRTKKFRKKLEKFRRKVINYTHMKIMSRHHSLVYRALVSLSGFVILGYVNTLSNKVNRFLKKKKANPEENIIN